MKIRSVYVSDRIAYDRFSQQHSQTHGRPVADDFAKVGRRPGTGKGMPLNIDDPSDLLGGQSCEAIVAPSLFRAFCR